LLVLLLTALLACLVDNPAQQITHWPPLLARPCGNRVARLRLKYDRQFLWLRHAGAPKHGAMLLAADEPRNAPKWSERVFMPRRESGQTARIFGQLPQLAPPAYLRGSFC
jgi:hypothetical protein